MTRLEERVAELLRSVEDLSTIVARQSDDIDRLDRRVALLLQREAQRDVDGGGTHVFADEKPPHW